VSARRRGAAIGATVLGCLVAAVVLRWPYLQQPLDRDTALYAAIGQRIGFGSLPYRDLFDHKQPLVYAVYWLIDALAPQRVGAIRLAAAVPAGLASAFTVLALQPRIGAVRAWGAAAVALVAGASSLVQGGDLNTEHLLVATAALSVLPALAFADSPRRWLPFAIGLLAGLAALTKAVGALTALAALFPLLAGREARGQSQLATFVLWLAGALVLPALLVAVYAVAGGLGDLWFSNVRYNKLYVDQAPRTLFPVGRDDILALAAGGAVVCALRLALLRGRDVLGATVLVWLVTAYAGAQLSGRNFPHYFAPLILPAAIALLLPLAVGPLRGRTAALATGAVAAVAAVVLTLPFARTLRDDLRQTPSGVAAKIYGPESEIWNRAFEVGAMLRRDAGAHSRVYVVGAEPEYYWTSALPAATRYLFDYPALVAPGHFIPEVTRSLCDRPPELLVLSGGSFPGYAQQCINPARYHEVDRSGPVAILALNG
jgi:hypothetical protein